jgi:hypothetical protein
VGHALKTVKEFRAVDMDVMKSMEGSPEHGDQANGADHHRSPEEGRCRHFGLGKEQWTAAAFTL